MRVRISVATSGTWRGWIAGVALVAAACGRPAAPARQPAETKAATYVGGAACAECHRKQTEAWRTSDHALAMARPDRASVRGRFSGSFTYNGVRTTFAGAGDRFTVTTDGPDGRLQEYPIAYTFGIFPLQQYLVAFPGGRYQALSVAWDSRPAETGGQRWFHLYPDERVDHRDVLHWTGPAQNWNYMCADCHSTNLLKQYDARTDAYQTTWTDLSVGCEACHGPSSRHVAWAERVRAKRADPDPTLGLTLSLKDTSGGLWALPPGATIATRTAPLSSRVEVETCAPCHARRARVWPEHHPGQPVGDAYGLALLDEGLYFADGQQQDEVYEYGSFVQSRMYAAGVTCSNCHDPHSGKRPLEGSFVCTQCHLPAKYATTAHHFHKPATDGAACVSCHMPKRYYMVVDGRRDHSFRIPRPDETVTYGTPNACTDCHRDRPAAWAAAAVARWYGPAAVARPSWTPVLQAARTRQAHGGTALARLTRNAAMPAIVRATAVSLIPRYPGPTAVEVIGRAASDADPLIRRAAAGALGVLEPVARVRIGAPLLGDPIRTVRLDALSPLVALDRSLFTDAAWTARERAVAEYRASHAFNAERAEGLVSLGALDQQLGRLDDAERQYRAAIRRQPQFVPGSLNLADLLRARGRETEAEEVLRTIIAAVPDAPDAHLALGLALARQKRMPQALASLARATALAPRDSHYAYVYAVALHDTGRAAEARRELERAAAIQSGNPDVLQALVSYSLEAGDRAGAIQWARQLAAIDPDDTGPRELIRRIARE